MPERSLVLDVLCVGHACYDLALAVDRHPGADEKCTAREMAGCGGGPAANAAVAAARFGARAGFAGYLGNDRWGDLHLEELEKAGVNTNWVVRGEAPTPLSVILSKPDGLRCVVNFRRETLPLCEDAVDFARCRAGVVLFDGHEPELSRALVRDARRRGAFTLLDAGSLHAGTRMLAGAVDYLVASERFALDFSGEKEETVALARLAETAPVAVVTLGDRGVIWKSAGGGGKMNAAVVTAVDTTGAGDTFHGVLAAAIAAGMEWRKSLEVAGAAAALCCTRLGARQGIPTRDEVQRFMEERQTTECRTQESGAGI
jgi:sulfofructose kinase